MDPPLGLYWQTPCVKQGWELLLASQGVEKVSPSPQTGLKAWLPQLLAAHDQAELLQLQKKRGNIQARTGSFQAAHAQIKHSWVNRGQCTDDESDASQEAAWAPNRYECGRRHGTDYETGDAEEADNVSLENQSPAAAGAVHC